MKLIKKYYLLLTISLVNLSILFIVLLKSNFNISFNENSGFYFFSTLIQSNAAIISIFGLFYIFKIQSIHSIIEEIYNSSLGLNLIVRERVREFRYSSFEKKKDIIEEYPNDDDLLAKMKKWYSYEKSIVDAKSKMKYPTLTIIVLISFQVLFLVLSNSIHSLGAVYELISFSVVALFQIYILALLGKAIFDMV